MKLLIYNYQCEVCKTRFLNFGLPEDTYGEFLLRTESGEVRYLNALNDPLVKEYKQIFNKITKNLGIPQRDRTVIFQFGLQITFDNSVNGEKYLIEAFPPCPNCKSTKMESWGEKIPLEVCPVDVEPVSHNEWSKLSHDKKVALIKNKISEKIDIYQKQNSISKRQAEYPSVKMFLWVLGLIIMFNILGPYLHPEHKEYIDNTKNNNYMTKH